MSRRRVKNIAFDDDEDYDEDESYGHSLEEESTFGVSPATASAYLIVRDCEGNRTLMPSLPEESAAAAAAADMSRLQVATPSASQVTIGGFGAPAAASPAPTSPSRPSAVSRLQQNRSSSPSVAGRRQQQQQQQQQQQGASASSNGDSSAPGVASAAAGVDSADSGADTPTSTTPNLQQKVAEAYRRHCEQLGNKSQVNLVIIGHVDAGKSTLTGHLLCLVGAVSERAVQRYEQLCRKVGKPSFQFAWVMDESEEERLRGVTMDVARAQFSTDNRIVTLLDCPGHKDFIPNMISGTMAADAALLVVNATTGAFESGFDQGGQTREHAVLARSVGISQLIVAVNKMDTADWAEDRFVEIRDKLSAYLKSLGFKPDSVSYCPCSGLDGANLVQRMKPGQCDWYSGPTLIELMDQLVAPRRPVDAPTRFYVTEATKGSGNTVQCHGQLLSGHLAQGQRLLLLPANQRATVKSVSQSEGSPAAACVFCGDTAAATVAGVDLGHFTIGSVLCPVASPCLCASRLRARVVLFNVNQPITKGYQALFHHQGLSVPVTFTRLLAQINKSTGGVERRHPRYILKSCCAEVEMALDKPVCLELYSNSRELGRFMVRERGVSIAAGTVIAVRPAQLEAAAAAAAV